MMFIMKQIRFQLQLEKIDCPDECNHCLIMYLIKTHNSSGQLFDVCFITVGNMADQRNHLCASIHNCVMHTIA